MNHTRSTLKTTNKLIALTLLISLIFTCVPASAIEYLFESGISYDKNDITVIFETDGNRKALSSGQSEDITKVDRSNKKDLIIQPEKVQSDAIFELYDIMRRNKKIDNCSSKEKQIVLSSLSNLS